MKMIRWPNKSWNIQFRIKILGTVFDVSTKYFLQIWSGAQAVMKLRPEYIAGPPAKLLANEMFEVTKDLEEEKILALNKIFGSARRSPLNVSYQMC